MVEDHRLLHGELLALACVDGRNLGASVGQNVWTKAQTYFTGTAGG